MNPFKIAATGLIIAAVSIVIRGNSAKASHCVTPEEVRANVTANSPGWTGVLLEGVELKRFAERIGSDQEGKNVTNVILYSKPQKNIWFYLFADKCLSQRGPITAARLIELTS